MANTPKPDSDRRTEIIPVRLSPRELRALDRVCAKLKLSHSAAVRRAIANLEAMSSVIMPRVKLTKEEREKLGPKE
jgi:hypothetical protein